MNAELSRRIRLRTADAADGAAIGAMLAASSFVVDAAVLPAGNRYLADVQGDVIGVAIMQQFGGDGLLRAACIDSAWRGQGVGTALIEHVLTEAALAALDTVVILTAGAGGFFARFGFREVSIGEVPDPVRRAVARGEVTGSDAVPMLLRLAAP